MVLTVLLPSSTGNESSEVIISCVCCSVTLQQRRYEENGCANQKWAYDERLGFLFPFNSNLTDKGTNIYLNKNCLNKIFFCSFRNYCS